MIVTEQLQVRDQPAFDMHRYNIQNQFVSDVLSKHATRMDINRSEAISSSSFNQKDITGDLEDPANKFIHDSENMQSSKKDSSDIQSELTDINRNEGELKWMSSAAQSSDEANTLDYMNSSGKNVFNYAIRRYLTLSYFPIPLLNHLICLPERQEIDQDSVR